MVRQRRRKYVPGARLTVPSSEGDWYESARIVAVVNVEDGKRFRVRYDRTGKESEKTYRLDEVMAWSITEPILE